jgi:hypothetical protein
MKTYKITGADAIRLAERDNLQVYCYANAVDDGGPVSVGLAREIAREDPGLVYVLVRHDGWIDKDGRALSQMQSYYVDDYFTSQGMYLGPDPDGAEPRWSNAEVKFFAAVSSSGPAFGVGMTADEALKDARKWVPANEPIDDLKVVEITKESYQRIKGGNPDAVEVVE